MLRKPTKVEKNKKEAKENQCIRKKERENPKKTCEKNPQKTRK